VRPEIISQLQLSSRVTEMPSVDPFSSTKKKNKKILMQAAVEKKLLEIGEKSETAICRICLGEEDDICNPLLSPCKCAGSMKYIH